MRKLGKRITGALMALVLVLGIIPATVFAENEESLPQEDEYIYYSDLFYGFPIYLTQNSFFQEYTNDTQNTFNTVFNEYKSSAGVVGTALEHAMDLFTSPSAIAAFASDYLGLTNFDYNEALDSANKKIMLSLLSDTDYSRVLTEYGKVGKVIGNMKKACGMIDSIVKFDPGQYLSEQDQNQTVTSIDTLVYYYLSNAYKDAYDAGIVTKFNNTFVSRFFDYLSFNEIKLTDYLSTASNAVDIAKTIMCCIVISNADMELIDDIIATQSDNTILKIGMTRLKNQLAGGSVTYFLDTYVKSKVLEKVGSMFDKLVKATVPVYGELALIVKEIKNTVFKYWPVVKYDDVMTYKVLEAYSYCFATSIINKAETFSDAPFLSQNIRQFEALFRAYIATNKLAMQALQGIADGVDPYGDVYATLLEAQEKGVESVTIEYKDPASNGLVTLSIPSFSTEAALIEQLNDIVTKNINFSVDNAIKKAEIFSQAILYYTKVKQGIETVHTPIVHYKTKYDGVDIYGSTLDSAKQSILQWNKEERMNLYRMIHENWTYNITSDIYLNAASDEIESNGLYGFGHIVYGNFLILGGTLTIPVNSNVSVDGKINLGYSYPTHSTLEVDGTLKVTGKIYSDVNEYMNAFVNVVNNGTLEAEAFLLTSNHNTIRNNGLMIIHGNFATGWGNSLYQQNDEAVLRIGGNYTNGFPARSYITAGTVVLDGDTQQTVKDFNVYNLTIENPSGVKYLNSIYVHGLYNSNSNPIELNGNVTYIYDTTDFYGDYDYKTLMPAQNLDLKTSVKAFIVNDNGYRITIPEGLNIEVDGNINLRNGSSLIVNGQLKTTGKIYSYVEDEMNAGVTVLNNGTLETECFELTSNHNITTNNGTLISHGNFATGWGNSLYQQNDEAVLRIGGNYTNGFPARSYITAGTVVLDGEIQQIIQNLCASAVILENGSEEGVVFSTSISPSTLFNHNGNKFTLRAGGTFVDYDGDGLKDNVDPHPTIHETCLTGHAYGAWIIDTPAVPNAGGQRHRTCSVCGKVETEEIPMAATPSFYGASLVLQNNLKVNLLVDKTFFTEVGYTNPSVVFTLDGRETTVSNYTVSGNYYVFSLANIAPNQMNDTITAVLHATYDEVEYTGEPLTYSIAQYCYSMLGKDNTADNLRTLLVNLLRYGAAAQRYTGHRADALADAALTAEQAAWGTPGDPVLTSVSNGQYATVDDPAVHWMGAALWLGNAVRMQFYFTAESVEDITVQIKTGDDEVLLSATKNDFTRSGDYYVLTFSGLGAGQMSEAVYVTAYRNETAVSNTVRYSVESYACAKQNDSDTNLAALVKAMMHYGNAAYAYSH